MRASGRYIILAFVWFSNLGCTAEPEPTPVDPNNVTLQSWEAGTTPYPYTAEEADSCRTQITLARSDLPKTLDLGPRFERIFDMEDLIRLPDENGPTELTVGGAWAVPFDINADGEDDLLIKLANPDGTTSMWQLLVIDGAPLPMEKATWASECWRVGDLDGNNTPELVCGGTVAHPMHLAVAWNDGDYTAGDVRTTALGIMEPDTITSADLDRDGDLDLMLAARGKANQIFENTVNEDGDFTAMDLLIPDEDALTFYVGAMTHDPFDPTGSVRVFEDNDGPEGHQRTYLLDALGENTPSYDPIPALCDLVTQAQIKDWLGRDPTEDELQTLTAVAVSIQIADPETGRIRIGHFNGLPGGDASSPMGALRFEVGGVVCEMKSTSGILFRSLSACFDRDAKTWGHFSPWSFENGVSSGVLWQEAWGAATIETGEGFPLIVITRGNETSSPSDYVTMQSLADIFDLELGTEYGSFDMGVFTLSPDGLFVEFGDESGMPWLGNFANLEIAWLTLAGEAKPQQYVLLGGFDGQIVVYRVLPQGNVLRARLKAKDGQTAYGANLYVELSDRLRGPFTPGMQKVQWRVGNYSDALDVGVADATTVAAIVHWNDGSIERFTNLDATTNRPVDLTQGTGTATTLPVP